MFVETVTRQDTVCSTVLGLPGIELAGTTLHRIVDIYRVPEYSGADKSLARPGRKQATATEGFEFHVSYLQS